jgi:hypothetical protein
MNDQEPILEILPEDEDEDPDVAGFYRREMEFLACRYRKDGPVIFNSIVPKSQIALIHTYADTLCMVKTLVRLGANVNLLDGMGRSPILHAIAKAGASWDHVAAPAVKYLLVHGADPNVMRSNHVPIWQTSGFTKEQFKCFLHLIAHGADVRGYTIPMWLRPYLTLVALCVPIHVPRLRRDSWLPRDLIRRLRLFLVTL